VLGWKPSASHTYATAANYTVWVEAFTGVGSVFRTATIPVYGKNSELLATECP